MRSISLYGLSDIRLTFEEGIDDYFARQVVFERLETRSFQRGHTRAWRRSSVPAASFIATSWKALTQHRKN